VLDREKDIVNGLLLEWRMAQERNDNNNKKE
jgi:hypothetical protein